MTSIENTTLPIGKVAIIAIAACSFCLTTAGVYFAAMNGVRAGFELRDKRFSEIDMKIQALQFENQLQNTNVKGVSDAGKFNYEQIQEIWNALKPEEIKPKKYRR